jgi:hypothetical protein
MRRGAKPTKPKVEATPRAVRKSGKDENPRVRDLEKRLAEALKREGEALERETASADLLRVISASPTHLEPVFESILDRAFAGRRWAGFSATMAV